MAVSIEEQGSKFITTEAIENQDGEQKVWDAVRGAFADRNCIGYWRYPLFSQVGETRKEPDILIIDREFGIIVIEVKSLNIDQIANINGQQWQLQNIDTTETNPHQQAEHQLRALISYSDREPALWRKVNGKAIVALPQITTEQWQQKGFDKIPDLPPIIFQDNLGKVRLIESIHQAHNIIPGTDLEDKDWELLLSAISGTSVLRKPPRPEVNTTGNTRSSVIESLRERLYEIDLQQEHIGISQTI